MDFNQPPNNNTKTNLENAVALFTACADVRENRSTAMVGPLMDTLLTDLNPADMLMVLGYIIGFQLSMLESLGIDPTSYAQVLGKQVLIGEMGSES